MSKTVSLCLTLGAAHLLSQLAAVPGLITDATALYRVGEFNESHLSDLPAPPQKDATPAEVDAWAKHLMEPVEISVATHGALKSALKTSIEKGMLPASKPARHLISELDLAPKED